MLRKMLAVAALFAAFSANADVSASNGRDYITLHKDSCTAEAVVKLIPADALEQFHAADATVGGKEFKACWVDLGPAVGVIYDDGDKGVIPKEAFREAGV